MPMPHEDGHPIARIADAMQKPSPKCERCDNLLLAFEQRGTVCNACLAPALRESIYNDPSLPTGALGKHVRPAPSFSESAARELDGAVREDHPCSELHCDIRAALDAGAPHSAACLLLGATEAPATAEVMRRHGLTGDLYRAQDWDVWATYHATHGRECLTCGAFNYSESWQGGEVCGNCLADLFPCAEG